MMAVAAGISKQWFCCILEKLGGEGKKSPTIYGEIHLQLP